MYLGHPGLSHYSVSNPCNKDHILRAPDAMEIHFVQHEGYGRSKNNIHGHHARAHTARINRKRRKEQAELVHRTKNHAITTTKSSSSNSASGTGATTPHVNETSSTQPENASTTALTLRKTLSPVYGAFSAGLFDPVAMPAAAEVLHYSTSPIIPHQNTF